MWFSLKHSVISPNNSYHPLCWMQQRASKSRKMRLSDCCPASDSVTTSSYSLFRAVSLTGPCPLCPDVNSPAPELSPEESFLLLLSAEDNTCLLQSRKNANGTSVRFPESGLDRTLGPKEAGKENKKKLNLKKNKKNKAVWRQVNK